MKRIPLLLLLVLSCFLIVISGCDESDIDSDTKRVKLVAAQNLQLQKDIDALKKEIQVREREIQKQKDLLAKCEKEKEKILEERKDIDPALRKEVEETSSQILKLTVENLQLKTKISELEGKISELEATNSNK